MFISESTFDIKPYATTAATSYRHQILLLLLENKNGKQIDELAKILNISRTAVQKHVLTLEQEGLISKDKRIKTMGRPSFVYVLTNAGIDYFPKHYALFSVMLLQDLAKEMTSGQLTNLMTRLGKKMAYRYRSRVEDLTQQNKLQGVVEIMQDLGFQANLIYDQKTADYKINAHNCIYHAIAQKHHEICTLDRVFIGELLGKNIELQSCMAKGDGSCCFQIAVI
jgi:predicted ArsR family transcriptional regulator